MSNSTRVLVVEDDAALRDAMCDTIQYGGYRVLSASNGEEALWCLKRERVDLIVSDHIATNEARKSEMRERAERFKNDSVFV